MNGFINLIMISVSLLLAFEYNSNVCMYAVNK